MASEKPGLSLPVIGDYIDDMAQRGRPRRQAAMSTADLERVGRLMFGDEWKMALARELGISFDSIKRYMAGKYPIHAGIVTELRRVVARKHRGLGIWVAALDRRLEAVAPDGGPVTADLPIELPDDPAPLL